MRAIALPGCLVPIGMKVITSGTRGIILTYAENHIRTMKIADLSTLEHQKVYDFPFQDCSAIKTIINTSVNTFGLLEDGQIFYFVSYRRNVEIIPNLRNVRAICESEHGFVVIRSSSPVAVLIEFYSDRGSNEMLKKYKKISISWEELPFSFERDTETSIICLVRLDKDTPITSLFQLLVVGEKQEIQFSKAVVFSINCSLFCVFYDNAKDMNSDVYPIRSFLSAVQDIKVFAAGILIVTLESGIVEAIYADGSKVTDKTLFLGLGDTWAVEKDPEMDSLYFSGKVECVNLTINPFTAETRLSFNIQRIKLPGVVGFSFLPAIGELLCITESNFIYTLKQQPSSAANVKETSGLVSKKLQSNLEDLTASRGNLLAAAEDIAYINVLSKPGEVAKQCKVTLTVKSLDLLDSNEPATRGRLLDLILDLECSSALQEVLKFGRNWILSLTLQSGNVGFHENLRWDPELSKPSRFKVFQNCSLDKTSLCAGINATLLGSVSGKENILAQVPLEVEYNMNCLYEALDPTRPVAVDRQFKIECDREEMIGDLLELMFKDPIGSESFVYGPILVTTEGNSIKFQSDDPSAVHLLKRLALFEGHRRGIWSGVSYEPRETIAVSTVDTEPESCGSNLTN